MPLCGFDELFHDADRRRPRLPVAAASGADATVLQALRQAADRGWVEPIMTGPEADLRRLAGQLGLDLTGFRLLAGEPASAAVAEVRAGRAGLLMKGQIATPTLMKAILDPDRGLRTGRVICQVVLLEVKERRFLLADTGVCIQPTVEQRLDILGSAVEAARKLGVDEPRVALLAASESVSEAMPETAESAALAARPWTGCQVQGPLSFDLAFAADAGDKKRIGGPVVGQADVMIFPNLLAANLTVKAIMYTADCRFGGLLMGCTAPVVFMSRSDTVETRLNSLALALRVAAH